MSEQQHQQQHRVEQPGPTPDGLALDRAQFAHELQELGLLEFAEEVNFSRLTDAPGDVGLSASARQGAAGPVPVGHNNPPPQPTSQVDVQACQLKNQAADVATAHAIQVLHLAKVGLHQLITSYNPRAAGSGGTDGSAKRRKTSRGADVSGSRSGSKGLRHFSMKVCEKVEAKGRTTYNEVADELVGEMSKVEAANKNGQYDEKNIRRRVYDAINVLMAMDIIQKEKKEITWKGFPRLGNHSLEKLKADRLARIREVEQKQLYLQDMIEQQKALKKLLERSSARAPSPTGTQLFLPFILVQAKPDATVEVKISEDMMDVQFDFYNSPFQIHDDSHVLKKMLEHQARQQPQPPQPPFPGPLAALHWPPPNGTAGVAAGLAASTAGFSPISDPALAQLAVAAAQANPLAYSYTPAAAAAAAYYQQHQQLLQQHQQQHQHQQQQQQQRPQAPAAQPGQSQGGEQQNQQHSGQQGQQAQPGQGQTSQPAQQQQGQQGQAQQSQHQQQPHHQSNPQQQQGHQSHQAHQPQATQHNQQSQHQPQQQQQPQQGGQQQQSQQQQGQQQQQQQGPQQQQSQQQQHHLQQQHIQTLQALQALQHARAGLPGLGLAPLGQPLGPPLGLAGGSGLGAAHGQYGGPQHAGSAVPPHLQQASQLVGQLTVGVPGAGPLSLTALGTGSGSQHGFAGLSQMAALQPASQLMPPMSQMPPALAAALALPSSQPAAQGGSMAAPVGGAASAAGVGEMGSMAAPSLQHGIQMGQLPGPSPAAAFPLVA